MKIHLFVTGSESFIGRAFVGRAIARGYAVTTLDTIDTERANHVVGDIRDRNLAELIPLGTDCVVHLAAISRDGDCREDPRSAFDVNIMGTQNVVDAAAARGVRQIVFASSEWVYGEVANDGVQNESRAIDANRISSEYALSKIVGERLIAMAVARGLAAGTVLRFGIVYGPRAANWSAVESIFAKTESDASVSVGSGSTARRFIHVEDIVSGIIAVVGRSGLETFNLSGDALVTLRDVFDVSCAIHDRHPEFVETNAARVSVRNPDNARAKAALGWAPVYDLEPGLRTLTGRLGSARELSAR